jgi:hypothetical protein
MSGARAPMTRASHSEPEMHLPAGKTCADCRHFERCSAIHGHIAADEVCDWWPVRFVQRPVVVKPLTSASALGWTAEEEEQFRALEQQQASGVTRC